LAIGASTAQDFKLRYYLKADNLHKVGFYATFSHLKEHPMQAAEKLSITMTAEMWREIRASVESGKFASTSEAMRDAVRLWQRERQERAELLESIRARIKASVDDPRPPLTMQQLKDQMDKQHQDTLPRQRT
jgi:antitoxin ParD1/3/4